MSKVLILALYSLLLAVGQFLFKFSAQQLDIDPSLKSNVSPYVYIIFKPSFIGGCLVYAFATLLWVGVLTQIDLSVAYPIAICFSIFLTILIGSLVFSETFTLEKFAGLALLVAAIFILSKNSG